MGEALAPFRDQVVIATKFGHDFGRELRDSSAAEQPAGAYQAGRRGVAEAPQDRPHRSVLSAPRRSRCADRGCRGSRQGADPARQGQAFWPVRSRRADRSAGRTRCSRSPRCRASIRYGGGSRRKRSCRRWKSSASASSRSARWGRASSPARSTRTRRSTATDMRNIVPRFTPEARKANQALVDLLARIAHAEAGNAGADRAGLAAGAEALDRADPRHHEACTPRGEHRRGRMST